MALSEARSPSRTYFVVDVFTRQALEGNALAVFTDGSGLSDEQMQKVARELNLSETVFLFPPERPEHAARLRIFTPAQEVRFAGHPTVGTSFVLLQQNWLPSDTKEFVLEELIGPVRVRVEQADGLLIWLTTPPITFGKTFPADACAEALHLAPSDLLKDVEPQLVSAGNPNIYIPLKDKAAVDRAYTELADVTRLKGPLAETVCMFVFTPTSEGAYSRMFAPEHGIVEDPATGSATGPLAAYMIKNKLAPTKAGSRFISEQGTRMGRRSILHVNICGDQGCDGIEVGGYVAPLARGEMQI